MKELPQGSTAPETRVRLLGLVNSLSDPDQQRMLQIWLHHWWGEVVYDIDAVRATMSHDIRYRCYGADTFGKDIAIDGIAAAEAMYRAQFDRGLMPGGPFDDERVAFGAWGMSIDAVFTSVFPGEMLPGVTPRLDAEALYLVTWRMAVAHPMDAKKGLMSGEILYPGPPLSIAPAGRDTIAYLLGRKQ
jgi:hypothetical protein